MIPDFSVTASDVDVSDRIRAFLVELRVVESIDRASDQMELALSDSAGELAVPRSGRELKVSMGYRGRLSPMGTFAHTETEIDLVPRVVRIRGTAADFKSSSAIKAPKTRAWDEVTVGEVVEQIAGEHGLEAAVSSSLASEAIAHIDQTAESDLHLLRRLATHYGATAKVAGGRLIFVLSGQQAPESASGETMPDVRIVAPPADRKALRTVSGRVTRSDKSRYGAVRASYYDVGAAMLEHVSVGAGQPVFELRDPRPDRAQATADAEAKLARLTRQTRALSIDLPGDPDLSAGGRVSTEGWGEGVDDTWQVVRVEHTINGSGGYRTRVEAEGLSDAGPDQPVR